MANERNPFKAANIISYATFALEDTNSEIKVTGLIAGEQMREFAVQNYLKHDAISCIQLTRIATAVGIRW